MLIQFGDTAKSQLLILPETAHDGVEIGKIIGGRAELPESLSALIGFYNAIDNKGALCLSINGERYACLQRQLDRVDSHLGWEGTGKGRIERIRELMALEDQHPDPDQR